jgi:hypothetical protein
MLYRELLTGELHKQREDFQNYVREQADDLNFYLYASSKNIRATRFVKD